MMLRYMNCKFLRSGALWLLSASFMSSSVICAQVMDKKWVGTWSCAPYAVGTANMPPSPGLTNNTIRQIVRVSIGGDSLRVKFSNGTASAPTVINAVTVAVSTDGKDAVNESTIKELTFKGNRNVSISAKTSVISDAVAFNVTPNSRLAITIYYGSTPSDMTGHVGSRTDSYLLTGNKTTAANFSGATITAHWYSICALDVFTASSAAAVAVLGNSITDGYGLTGGLQNRWTDVFSEALLNNTQTKNVSVLNLGIGGTNVASGETGGLKRYEQDILGQTGVRWFIIFYGVNDIGGGASASTVINAYKTMITAAHAKNIKVYGATITPFNGHSYYTVAHEAVRSEVNAWIRTGGMFDAVLDFDKAVRDPNDTTKFKSALKNDWLHPNVDGYKAIGQSVDLKLFNDATEVGYKRDSYRLQNNVFTVEKFNGAGRITFSTESNSFVSIKVYSMLGQEVVTPVAGRFLTGIHYVNMNDCKLTNGTYLFTMRSDSRYTNRTVVF